MEAYLKEMRKDTLLIPTCRNVDAYLNSKQYVVWKGYEQGFACKTWSDHLRGYCIHWLLS